MKADSRRGMGMAAGGGASVEDAIMQWASDNIFELQPYIRDTVGPDRRGGSEVPMPRAELGQRMLDLRHGGWDVTRFLQMGQDSALNGHVDERDGWFVMYGGRVESMSDAKAASELLRMFRGLLPGMLDGYIEPPAELARAPAGVPPGTSATARRRSAKAGTRSAARFGRARHRGRSNHDGSMDAHDNAGEESEWNATSITARSSQPAGPSSGNG